MPKDSQSVNSEPGRDRRAAMAAAKHRPVRATRGPERSERSLPIAFNYIRVSTREQARTGGGAEGYSIPAQRQAGQDKSKQLGAVITATYVDAGESAKTAQRPELQRMLKDIKKIRPDYVIVHKIDRLARNREDDIAINLLLRRSGVTLVSCTENIDDTPSGKLLYGLMAEIAQFYSGNLAQEVMKGLVRKAEEGGTPYRAPLGYLNRKETRDGVEYSWVELDPERADIVRWCIIQYATGEWTVLGLTLAARQKGLTSRPTATKPSRPVGLTTMHNLLRNPYYMGLVPYQGIHYEGKHPQLVEPDVWLAVQDTLAAHAHTGEKDRKHTHYLRGSIFCSECRGRLVYSRNTGNGGTYEYFMCVKKKTKANNCRRPAVRLERIEDGIAAFYTRFQITQTRVEQIRAGVLAEMADRQAEAKLSVERATKTKTRLQAERQKLLEAHYAGAIPQDMLASEMNRMTRTLADADREITAAQATMAQVQTTLAAALGAAASCEAQYQQATPAIRRQINQGFFEKLLIGEDGSVEQPELTEPFAALLTNGHILTLDAPETSQNAVDGPATSGASPAVPKRSRPSRVFLATFGKTGNARSRPGVSGEHGLNKTYVVELRGLEPLTPTLPVW